MMGDGEGGDGEGGDGEGGGWKALICVVGYVS